jgi:hypothetical protein
VLVPHILVTSSLWHHRLKKATRKGVRRHVHPGRRQVGQVGGTSMSCPGPLTSKVLVSSFCCRDTWRENCKWLCGAALPLWDPSLDCIFANLVPTQFFYHGQIPVKAVLWIYPSGKSVLFRHILPKNDSIFRANIKSFGLLNDRLIYLKSHNCSFFYNSQF